jgi:hypothetical protein
MELKYIMCVLQFLQLSMQITTAIYENNTFSYDYCFLLKKINNKFCNKDYKYLNHY